ncbi:ATP-binding protein [Pseudobacteriovorax antillogorgiicola]|uniref:ATP-binding protein n=1 Tax=Pseudobacteriovorax antillogorgiicola TaxID=1513793 RepID=UPI0010469E1A|nr:ATP-binding protein [Pseudobacteriovorax antillogorgiicola]
MARKLGKNVPEFVFVGDDYLIPYELNKIMQRVFTHLLRNSIDHGIEGPNERIYDGKPHSGRIIFHITYQDNVLSIRYEDDGRGLDISSLKKTIKIDNPIRQDIIESIFTSVTSTSASITDISGRGIGMAAVRSFLEDSGGSIEVDPKEINSAFQPVFFTITIKPKQKLKNIRHLIGFNPRFQNKQARGF